MPSLCISEIFWIFYSEHILLIRKKEGLRFVFCTKEICICCFFKSPVLHGAIIRIGIEEENTERKRKVFALTLKPHKLPAPACSSVIIDAPNRTQKQVPLCLLCHPSVASMTSGQTGRLPSIPKRVSSLELPAWTSPSVVRFSWDCETGTQRIHQASPQLNFLWPHVLRVYTCMGFPPVHFWHHILPSLKQLRQPINEGWAHLTLFFRTMIYQNSIFCAFRHFLSSLPFSPSYLKGDFFQRWREWSESPLLNAPKLMSPLPSQLERLPGKVRAVLVYRVSGPFSSPRHLPVMQLCLCAAAAAWNIIFPPFSAWQTPI